MAMFGIDEDIECLQDVPVAGPSGEQLCLARKLSTHYFIGAVYVRDDGYVLKVRAKNAYYPVPQGDDLATLQHAGMLPKAFPPYSISALQYVAGYWLWIVLVLAVVGTVISRIAKMRASPCARAARISTAVTSPVAEPRDTTRRRSSAPDEVSAASRVAVAEEALPGEHEGELPEHILDAAQIQSIAFGGVVITRERIVATDGSVSFRADDVRALSIIDGYASTHPEGEAIYGTLLAGIGIYNAATTSSWPWRLGFVILAGLGLWTLANLRKRVTKMRLSHGVAAPTTLVCKIRLPPEELPALARRCGQLGYRVS